MKNKSFNKIKFLLAIPLIIFIIFIIINTTKNEDDELKNDFYTNINKELLEHKELDSDKEYWSLFGTETQEKIDDKTKEIVKEIVANEGSYEKNSDEYKICQLYNSIVNRQDDLSKINTYINLIDKSNSIKELMNNVSKINNELSIGIFINTTLMNDFIDNKETVIDVDGFIFDYANPYSDYYTNPLYSSYIAKYIEYDRKIFELYGYTEEEAKESVRKISRFYAEIANNSKSMEELTDKKSCYNIISLNELEEIYSNIDIKQFINKYGNYKISILDKEQAKALNNYFIESNLDTLKEYAKLQILQNYGEYVDTDYYNLMNELSADVLGTDITKDTVEDYAADIITLYFDTTISQKYIEKYADDEAITDFTNIINDIVKEYKNKINNNTWLSEETKEKALLKLENLVINVGYPKEWEEYSSKYNLNNNLFNNIINMKSVVVNFNNESIIKNKDFWLMSPLTVNAYYHPQENSINFPIALLECEVYNKDNSYYKNLGSLGMIVAHEITHAFDNTGALFDENGNMNNWWKEEDYKEFEKLQNEVIEYYNEYKINGKSVKGKQTVGENIADLGAVSCIVDIAKSKGASNEELKELFESFANIWASKATDEYTKLLLIMDTHSPDKIRVNAVLSSIDEFYNVYDISEKNEMYKEKRVKVW